MSGLDKGLGGLGVWGGGEGSGGIRCMGGGSIRLVCLVYWGLTPQQQPGSYQGGEMMMMKSAVFIYISLREQRTVGLKLIPTRYGVSDLAEVWQ